MDIHDRFKLIDNAYKSYYNELLKSGKLLVRDTDTGIWGYAGSSECFELFNKIKLSGYKNFIDLGSGDGKVVAIASLFTKAAGIESDKELYSDSVRIIDSLAKSRAADKKSVTLINGNFMQHDLSKYDIVFMNPDKIFTLEFEHKLLKELRGTLFIYNRIFAPRSLKKGKTFWVRQMPVVSFTNI